ncbi:MAG TPA: hypothetical protein VHC69_00390 [Polyangiaceae bacterium]|nr:hypothetical protein [Polyangiaceae bacterium]
MTLSAVRVLQGAVFVGVLVAVACSSGDGSTGTTEQSATAGKAAGNASPIPGLGNGNQSTGLGNPGKGAPASHGAKANYCPASGCACSDGIDNDGDGLVDAADPECVGAEDNDEATFATGMPGDNRDPKWQDCFFDGNSGAGDDRCRYPTGCLTGAIPQTDPSCAITQYCLDHCAAFAPKNCDCFGCCTVPFGPDTVDSGAGTVDIVLTKTCTAAKLDDTTACPRCVKSTTCEPPTNPPPTNPPPTNPPPTSTTPPPTNPPPTSTTPPENPPPPTCADGSPICSDMQPCVQSLVCVSGCCEPSVR